MSGEAPGRRRAGCLNPRNPLGCLTWLAFLSGAAFAGTVWPGGLPPWCFKAAVVVWSVAGAVAAFWIFVAAWLVRAFNRMREDSRPPGAGNP
ncbi:MAG: hypothetical protein IT452_01020 [Planctomycetia bacterium]|nr:hypothetical protein [Planctomycetia bacterium]